MDTSVHFKRGKPKIHKRENRIEKRPLLIRIPDMGGPSFDLFVIPPAEMDKHTAIDYVQETIEFAKATYEGAAIFRGFKKSLEREGFRIPETLVTHIYW